MATTTIRATTNSRHDEDEVMACERRVFNQYSAQQQYINNDFVRILLEILCVVVVIVHLAHAEDVSLSSPFQGVTADSLLLPDMPVTRLAFGSCNKHDRAQPFWKILIERQCQVFIWLGDIIYADIKVGILPHSRISQPPSETRKKYMTQKAEQGYRSFANTRPIIVGTWDDHDYGINDGDETYPDKDVSKQLLMEFLEEPAESVRLKRHGVYAAYTFGPPGKRVKSILLDGRYFLHADVGPEADMLGEQQWQWLEQELRNTDAQIVLIGSGVQVISDDKNIAVQAESWGRYPQSRTRIINLIKSTNTSGALFLSGDIHMAEINLMRCSPVDYPLYDITSSGMTHSWRDVIGLEWVLRLGHFVIPKTFQISHVYDGQNIAVLNIDWNEPITISIDILNAQGGVEIHHSIALSELQPSAAHRESCSDEERRLSLLEPEKRPHQWLWKPRLLLVGTMLISICIISLSFIVFVLRLIMLSCENRTRARSEKKKTQ